jgi:hypothetical protein
MPILRKHYNGYTAKGSSGPINLFNPLSVVKALACNNVFDYWVETGTVTCYSHQPTLTMIKGRYSFLTQNLWRTSEAFRSQFNLLMTQATVELKIDEFVNFKTYYFYFFLS